MFFDFKIKSYSDLKAKLSTGSRKCKENYESENFFNSSKSSLCFYQDNALKIFGNHDDDILGIGYMLFKENKSFFFSKFDNRFNSIF